LIPSGLSEFQERLEVGLVAQSTPVILIAEIDRVLPGSVSCLTVSPDGRWLLLPLFARRGGDLMMIENFR
jgi:hypothetical protein